MNLSEEIREDYETCVYSVLQEYPDEKLNTQFEISVDMINGWDYEDEFGNFDVRNQVGLSFYSATICVNHRDGPEWGTDSLNNSLIGFMDEQPIISFQNREC